MDKKKTGSQKKSPKLNKKSVRRLDTSELKTAQGGSFIICIIRPQCPGGGTKV